MNNNKGDTNTLQVGEMKGLFYLNHRNETKESKSQIPEIIDFTKQCIKYLYFRPFKIINISDKVLDYTNNNSVDDNVNLMDPASPIINNIGMIRKIYNHDDIINFKVSINNITMYFDIDIAGEDSNNISLLIHWFDNKDKLYKFMCIRVEIVGEEVYVYQYRLVFISKNKYNVKQHIQSNYINNINLITPTEYNIISEALKVFISLRKEDTIPNRNDIKSINYTNFEMYVFRKILPDIDSLIYPFVTYKGIPCIDNFERPKENIEPDDALNIPIVSLTEKEWSFIYKYIDKTYPDVIALSEVFSHLRYGEYLKMRYSGSVGEIEFDDLITIRMKYHYGDDMISIMLLSNNNNGIGESFIELYIKDIDYFRGIENVCHAKGWAKFNNSTVLPFDIESGYEAFPTPFLNSDLLMDIVYKMIILNVILYDRPERIRCVQEIKNVPLKNTNHNSKNNKRKGIQKYDKVIERILMPVKEAKEYVARMTNEHMDREYVLESWERVGHYRIYHKDTEHEKKVWIDPVKCTRHLPLTKKDILIKL